MNIALFPSAFHPNLGGVEELTRQLAHALRRRQHRVTIVTQRWPRDLPAYEEFENLPVHRVPFTRAPQGYGLPALKARAGWNARRIEAGAQTAHILRETGAELVHIQCAGPNAFYAHAAARGLDLPLVLSNQGELTIDATGLHGSRWMREVWRSIARDAAQITACSRDTLRDLENFAAPISLAGRARVIYNGIALADFLAESPAAPTHSSNAPAESPNAPAELFAAPAESHNAPAQSSNAPAQSRPYVLALGRFVKQKGFDILIEAWKRADLPAFDLVIAGDGPEKAALQSAAHGLSGVRFWGRAERADVVRLLRGCAWFVLPSRVEPQGIVNLEAMAAGRAVVAARTGGVSEIVIDGQTGVLFEMGNVEELAAALREMAAQPARLDAMGAAGRARAQSFDWDVLAGQYETVYQEALGK